MSGVRGMMGPALKELESGFGRIEDIHREVKSSTSKEVGRDPGLSGTGKAGGKFEGRKVELRQSEVSKGVDAMSRDSKARLGEGRGFGAKVANIVLGIIPAVAIGLAKGVATLAGLVGSVVVGGALKLAGKALGTEAEDRQRIESWRDRLGSEPMEGSILTSGKDVTLGDQTMPLADALDAARGKLGSQVSKEDIVKYVAMGERVVHALSNAPEGSRRDRAELKDIHGQTVGVRANLEVTRAISWYLQAKALVDNTGHGDGAFLKSGAMIAKDPGNKLFDFLASSNNTYGRVSTHMKERSESRPQGADLNVLNTAWKGGFDGMVFAGLGGQPLQYGIEDYENRFPSKGGSLLFDKLKPSGGANDEVPELYLKWEEVGTPFAFGGGANSASNSLADNMWNQKDAISRFYQHTRSAHEDASPEGYRGEKLTKGPAKEWFDRFQTEVNALFGIDQKTKDKMLKHVESYGASEMNKALDLLIDAGNRGTGEVLGNEKKRLENLKSDFGTWLNSMGPDMGIARKGQEVHVKLTGAVQ